MNSKKYDIFISYRREGGSDFARQMQLKLQQYRYKVFLDYDELKDGRFDQRIIEAIKQAPVFMFILSPHALDRCVEEDDWVRREIELALQLEKHIVPVNPDRLFDGFPHNCPEVICHGLGQHQFTEIFTGASFVTLVDEMVRLRIRPLLPEADTSTLQESVGAVIHIETDIDCRILKFGKEIGIARAGEDTVIRLRKGKHKLEFVSLEHPDDRHAETYLVEDNEMEDFLTVELVPVREKRKKQEELNRNYDVYISYSRKDTAIADRVCAAFDKAHISYFIDRQRLAGGQEYPEKLAAAIENSRLVLLLGSKNAYSSKLIQSEIYFAFNVKEKNFIIPYLIDNTPLPKKFEFAVCSINWRNMQDYPIDTALVKDVLQLLNR